ncbi:transmembrane protease serine 6-like isoform X2 [Ornithodoros turicata]|uniref:transmembrane protease serine 6-like isoform X2 n=1 Tax=Ornithodoros turicata TaxID=34597 RepID=UPI00313997E2
MIMWTSFLYSVPHGAFPGMFPYEWQTCRECMPITCGLPRNPWDRHGRTYGGDGSSRGRYPWHAVIYANGVPIGGGALISCKLVLTTAYLVQDHSTQELLVKLGKVDMQRTSPTERTFKVFQKSLHPLWNPDKDLYSNDLALLLLEREVDFESSNGFINTVCLPPALSDAKGWLTLTGFGYDLSGRKMNTMQELNIKKLPQDLCPLFRNKPHNFCGLGTDAGICAGDRGNPIVQITPSGQFMLVGVSNDYQCKAGGTDVYTQVSFFLDFVCNAPIVP